MDQTLIPAGLEQFLQFAILLFVVAGLVCQFTTQRHIKALIDTVGKVDSPPDKVETRLVRVETRLDRVEEDLRAIGKKADASLDLHNAVQVDMKVLQASVDRLESYFEAPKLKSL